MTTVTALFLSLQLATIDETSSSTRRRHTEPFLKPPDKNSFAMKRLPSIPVAGQDGTLHRKLETNIITDFTKFILIQLLWIGSDLQYTIK